jgi:hypothetical protein
MSTPTSARDTDRLGTAFVPNPRRPSDPPLPATAEPSPAVRPEPDEPVGLFGRFTWLTPAAGIACTVAVFVAMFVLTWAAGGLTPFND